MLRDMHRFHCFVVRKVSTYIQCFISLQQNRKGGKDMDFVIDRFGTEDACNLVCHLLREGLNMFSMKSIRVRKETDIREVDTVFRLLERKI